MTFKIKGVCKMRRRAIIHTIAIVLVMMFTGCIVPIPPSPEASPSEIVETFALWHGAGYFGACYSLMSEEYRNSTDDSTFKEKMSQCKPAFSHYEFVEVRSAKNDGDSASVQIIYVKKPDPVLDLPNPFDNPKNKTKTINLIKEDKRWRLTDLHCELKGK